MRLKDKVAIVTGGARGIGLACAERFIAEGARVMLTDVLAEPLKASAERIGASFTVSDAANHAEVRAALDRLLELHGRVDILLSNAGTVGRPADFLDLSEEDFDRVIRVNLKSQFLSGQAVARQMVRQGGGGAIINMSSIMAQVAAPDLVPYGASKAAASQLTRGMALALAPYGIRVNAIGPGTVATEMSLASGVAASDDALRLVLSRTPLGRLGNPDEIAGVAAFLASSDASYITGQTIFPDGGRLSLNYLAAPGARA